MGGLQAVAASSAGQRELSVMTCPWQQGAPQTGTVLPAPTDACSQPASGQLAAEPHQAVLPTDTSAPGSSV